MAPIPNCNKCMLPIKSHYTNLEHTVQILHDRGIREFVFVVAPITEHEFDTIVYRLQLTYKDSVFIKYTTVGYYPGCNNIVTMKTVASYLGDSYVIESDQYLLEEQLDFIGQGYEQTTVFAQRRYDQEDWSILADENGYIKKILQENPSGDDYCLSGIIYLSELGGGYLSQQLRVCTDTTIYWESLLDPECIEMKLYKCESPYAIEYDSISDLVNNKLMRPVQIADAVQDKFAKESPIRLDSMTNTTYLIQYNKESKVLRIPGYGTDMFINHERESRVESYVESATYGQINPHSVYYDNYHVKMTDYLEGYENLHSMSNIPAVMSVLYNLHNLPVSRFIESECAISLEDELVDYERVFGDMFQYIPEYNDYLTTKKYILQIINSPRHPCIAHRDLVPRNIMVHKDTGKVNLIDWEYAGVLNAYWDLASFVCEYADEYQEPLEDVAYQVYEHYPERVRAYTLYEWIAVVDFVWSSWALAKCKLGDDVLEYGIRRYERCKKILVEKILF